MKVNLNAALFNADISILVQVSGQNIICCYIFKIPSLLFAEAGKVGKTSFLHHSKPFAKQFAETIVKTKSNRYFWVRFKNESNSLKHECSGK